MKTKPIFPHKGCGIAGAKKARHAKKGSSTPGSTKVSSCKASWRQRGWAKRARSYKDHDYSTITAQMNKKGIGEEVKG
jgi:hypothetical protein